MQSFRKGQPMNSGDSTVPLLGVSRQAQNVSTACLGGPTIWYYVRSLAVRFQPYRAGWLADRSTPLDCPCSSPPSPLAE